MKYFCRFINEEGDEDFKVYMDMWQGITMMQGALRNYKKAIRLQNNLQLDGFPANRESTDDPIARQVEINLLKVEIKEIQRNIEQMYNENVLKIDMRQTL